jgi:uncharacterized protein involved in exopolysaccharide biosynthesis
LVDVADLITRHLRLFLIITGASVLLSAVLALFAPPKYDSATTLYHVDGGGGGMLLEAGSLARDLGFSVPGVGVALEVPDIAESRMVRDRLLTRSWSVDSHETPVTLYELWGLSGTPEGELRERAHHILAKRISSKVEDSGLVRIVVRMERPSLAADIANAVAAEVMSYLREEHTRSATQNREYVDARLADISKRLAIAEDSLMQFREENRRIEESPELQTEEGRLLRDVEVNQQLYIALREQSELARIEEIRDAPPVCVLDAAVPPWRKAYPRRMTFVIIGAVGGGLVSLLAILVWEGLSLMMAGGASRERLLAIRARLGMRRQRRGVARRPGAGAL